MKEIKGEIKDRCYICGRTNESFFGDFNIGNVDFKAAQVNAIEGIREEIEKLIASFKEELLQLLSSIENLPGDINVADTPSLAKITDYVSDRTLLKDQDKGYDTAEKKLKKLIVSSAREELGTLLTMLDDVESIAGQMNPIDSYMLKSNRLVHGLKLPKKGSAAFFLEIAKLKERRQILETGKDLELFKLYPKKIDQYFHVNGEHLMIKHTREGEHWDFVNREFKGKHYHYPEILDSEVIHIDLLVYTCYVCQSMFSEASCAAWDVLTPDNHD